MYYRNSKSVEETYISEKKLKSHSWYHIALRSRKESSNDMHTVAMFINGYDDLKASINHYTPFESA